MRSNGNGELVGDGRTDSGGVAGDSEGAVDEGAEVEGAEDVEHLAEHDGHVAAGRVSVSPVKAAVELRPRARSLLEAVGRRRRRGLRRLLLLLLASFDEGGRGEPSTVLRRSLPAAGGGRWEREETSRAEGE